MNHESIVLLAAVLFFTAGLVTAAIGLTLGLGWRSERDRAVGTLRAFEARGWYAAPPSSVRLRGERVNTHGATLLPPPPSMPRAIGADVQEGARDTLPNESITRVIAVPR